MATSVPTSHHRLQDKVAIITGGASGIGAATAKLFHQQGAKVVIADIQDSLGQAVVENLAGAAGKDDGVTVTYIHCDVSNEDDVARLVDATVEKFGKLDIMYCNAGIVDGVPGGSIVDASKVDLDRLVQVNMVGAFLGAKHAARVMIPRGSGVVLFTASACTAIGGLGSHAYAMTKYGIFGLTRNLTGELGGHGVRVNCISPSGLVTGDVAAQMSEEQLGQAEGFLSATGNLKGKILKADDVARAALFLASDDAQYVSGVNLLVDGGFSTINPTLLNAMSVVDHGSMINGSV
ncbi:Tropinone reductase-like 1 [Linum grandiflorum]